MLGEAGDYVANHVIIGSVFIKKMCKEIVLIELIIKIILRGEQSHAKGYIKVQKDQ